MLRPDLVLVSVSTEIALKIPCLPPFVLKFSLLLLACLLLSGAGTSQTTRWTPFRVDKLITVSFPTPPQEMDIPRSMAATDFPNRNDPQVLAARGFVAEDAVATYALVCVPLKEAPALPPTFAARAAYYRARTIPLLVSHARGQLLEQEVSQKNGLDLITVKYRVLGPTGSPIVKYMRMSTVERVIYQLSFVPKDKTGATSTAQRIRFFNSFSIKTNPTGQITPLKLSRGRTMLKKH